jgi:nicotinate-nucleotide adenylyltransferase
MSSSNLPAGTESIRPAADPRRIALFGGSFDPVHLGHVHLAERARKALALDEVRFIPCRISPHKTGTPPVRSADRLEMLRLATRGLPWAVVDDMEIRRDAPSFSYQTAEAMAAQFPGARLFWIMGGDQWDALDRWEQPERLTALVECIVFDRGHPLPPRDGCRLHVLTDRHPASATGIRDAIACGETTHAWLAPAVAQWIRDHSLYQK